MKKLLGITLAGFLLLVPIVVSATSISYIDTVVDTVDLKVFVTDKIVGGGYYTDYQAFVNNSEKQVELFCVENEPAYINHDVTYDLYGLESTADTNIQAAWIAEKYWNASDYTKGQAQLAIWDLLDTISGKEDITSGYTDAIDILKEVSGVNNLYDYTSNWFIAVNDGRQDYLMRAAPVPEPATLLLLGTGLIGLAGASRKKFKK